MVVGNLIKLYVIIIVIIKDMCECRKTINLNSLPNEFLIGMASASYQIEGAWDIDGKSVNIWDYFIHKYPAKIADRSTAHIACDSYHKYKEDIALLKKIGVDHYRFSLSWSRILPNGRTNYVNEAGIRYYHSILDELEKNGIIPFVTLYHWDHPQNLEKLGGWLNEEMAYIYSDYARFVFKEFGYRVKFFSTVNEPGIYCTRSYALNVFAPGNKNLTGFGEYMCLQNMLKGHALAYRIYDKEYRSKQKGKVGIVVQCMTPYSNNQTDSSSIDIAFDFECGWQIHPIYSKTGDYPPIMKQRIAKRSKLQGYYRSRLPILSHDWIKLIKGSADYLGLNHYTSNVVTKLPKSSQLTWPNDAGLLYSFDPSWLPSESAWLKFNPKGLGDILRMIKNKYRNPPVYITESGVSDNNGVDDNFRINYLYSNMKDMLIAIKKDKCKVKAYTIWSFLDSFEWDVGYTEKFGLVAVDFNNANLTRTLKKSVTWLKTVLATRQLKPLS